MLASLYGNLTHLGNGQIMAVIRRTGIVISVVAFKKNVLGVLVAVPSFILPVCPVRGLPDV
jgi:hypothetical protein